MSNQQNGKAKQFKPYKSYHFRGKDPVITQMRNAIDDAKRADPGVTYKRMHDDSGVSTTTFYNWFKGKTRRPQFAACQASMKAIGYSFNLKRDE